MYKLIGTDGKKYGPISSEQVRQWIVEGRANGDTKTQAAEESDWKPLSQRPEFALFLQVSAVPPVITASAPALPPPSSGAKSTSTLVIVLIAVVFGGLFVIAILAALLLPAIQGARERARRASCMSNLKIIGLGCHLYAQDHQGKYPDQIKDLFPNYVTNQKYFVCPSTRGTAGTIGYVYLKGFSESETGDLILAYDADGNHRGDGRVILFGDGHAQWMSEDNFKKALQDQEKALQKRTPPDVEKK